MLSGGVAGEGKSYIPPIFLTAFNYENNIHSWQVVGAVPLTSNCLKHRLVRHEVDLTTPDDCPIITVEKELEATVNQLNELGYNGKAILVKLKQRPTSLNNCLPVDTPHEDRIKALASGGMSHQSMFFTIGPTCLSTD